MAKVVEAQEFRLVDEEGKRRGTWGVRGGMAGFMMCDDAGRERAALLVDRQGNGGLSLGDPI